MKKTILITGSTDGIGKLTAIKLAKEGHEVFIHGRNAEKLETVISENSPISNNEAIKGFTADLSTIASVKKLAETIKNEIPKIDILINNAGVYKSKLTNNQNGLDLRFAVNYLAPYVLTNELISIVNSKVINLSSAAQAPVSLDALVGKNAISEQVAYAQSKLALTMWSFYLAKKQSKVNIIAVNPGSLLNTNMVKEAFGTHWSSVDKGADILCELATDDRHENATGVYFDNDKGTYGNAHSDAYDEDKIEKLIEQTEHILASL